MLDSNNKSIFLINVPFLLLNFLKIPFKENNRPDINSLLLRHILKLVQELFRSPSLERNILEIASNGFLLLVIRVQVDVVNGKNLALRREKEPYYHFIEIGSELFHLPYELIHIDLLSRPFIFILFQNTLVFEEFLVRLLTLFFISDLDKLFNSRSEQLIHSEQEISFVAHNEPLEVLELVGVKCSRQTRRHPAQKKVEVQFRLSFSLAVLQDFLRYQLLRLYYSLVEGVEEAEEDVEVLRAVHQLVVFLEKGDEFKVLRLFLLHFERLHLGPVLQQSQVFHVFIQLEEVFIVFTLLGLLLLPVVVVISPYVAHIYCFGLWLFSFHNVFLPVFCQHLVQVCLEN